MFRAVVCSETRARAAPCSDGAACSGAFLDESSAVSPREGNPEVLVFPSRPFDAKNPFLAVVTENRKLNEGGERHLMHLELDISNSKIR